MGKLDDIINKLQSVTDDVIDEGLLKVVDKNKSEAIDMNTSQLFSGKDSQGQAFGQYHSQSYAAFKLSLNPAGVVDFKLTGAFYDGFYLRTDKFPITFDSTDEKTDKLKQLGGENIFGLDQENLEKFRQEIKPDVQDLYRSLLQL